MDLATLGLQVDSSGVRRATGDLSRFDKAAGGTSKAALAVGRSLGILAAGALSLAAGGRIIKVAQSYTQLTNSLRALGQSGDQAVATLDKIAGVASRTRSPLEATAQLYQRITIAGRDLGASQEQVLRFTENVGLALAQSGSSASEASGALLQLSQAMAGGVVRAEEFNSILEGAFPIAQAAANAIDGASGSVGKLRQMVVDGQVSSKEFFDAILSQSDALEEAFANTVPTIGQSLGVLGDAFTVLIGKIDQASGASEAIARAILSVANGVRTATEFIVTNMDTIQTVFGTVAGSAAVLAGIIATRLAVSIGATLVTSVVTAVGQMIALELALGATSTAAAVAGASVKLFSGALAVLKGAIISTGIGALIIGAGYLVYEFTRLVKATGGFGEALQLVLNVAKSVFVGIGKTAWGLHDIMGGVAQGIAAAFVRSFSSIAKAWDSLINGMGAAWNAMAGTAFGESLGLGSMGTSNLAGTINSAADSMVEAAVSRIATGGARIKSAAEGVAESVAVMRASIQEYEASAESATAPTTNLDEVLGDLGDTANGGGGGGAAGALDEAAKSAEKLIDKVKNGVANFGASVGGTFVDLLFGDIDSVKDFFGQIFDAFKSLIKDLVTTAIRNKIMLSFGVSGGGAMGGGLVQSGGGLLKSAGGLLGGGGGMLGSLGTGLMGGAGVFSAGTGLLGGLGSTLSATFGAGGGIGGLFSVGANAALAGGGFMATLGAALPVIGIAAGIGALLFGLLRKKEKTIEEGISGLITMENAVFSTYKEIETSRFFGLFKSRRTETSRIGSRQAEPLVMAARQVQESVVDSADQLGISANVFRGFSFRFKETLKDLSDEERLRAVEDQMKRMGDALAGRALGSAFNRLREIGEGQSDTLNRLATNLSTVNDAFRDLGFQLYDVSIWGGDAAYQFAQLFDGLDNFTSATSAYYDAFYTDAEKLANLQSRLMSGLADAGVEAIPKSRKAYRDMVDAAMASGADELAASLIQLSPLMAQISEATSQFASSLDASDFVSRADFVYAQSRVANQNYNPSYSERENIAPLLRELITAVREGDNEVIQNTARLADETYRANNTPGVA